MRKLNSILSKYLLFAVPFHLLFFAAAWLRSCGVAFFGSAAVKTAIDVLSWNFILWFAVIVVMVAQLLFNGEYREGFFSGINRAARIGERDERESMAIDRASRYAYVSTLAMMLVVLFLLSVTVTVGKLPPEKVMDGKTKTLSIGVGFSFTDDKQVKSAPADGSETLFTTADFPLSKWGLVAVLLGWHLLGYFFYIRSRHKQP